MSPKKTRSKTSERRASARPDEAATAKFKVVILPENLLKEEAGNGRGEPASQPCPSVIELSSPKSGNPELYLFDEPRGRIYQMMGFKESPRSWFVNDAVGRDGSLVLTTEVDPLFLILPYLKNCEMFRPLEQIVVDPQFPQCGKLLSCKDLERRMKLVADVKDLKDMRAYRFSTEKCANWLISKLDKVQRELRDRGVHVAAGAQAATFIRSKKEKAAGKDDYRRYAHGIVSEMLPKDVSEALLEQLGLSAATRDEEPPEDLLEPPRKRAKGSSDQTDPIEDYSVGGASSWRPAEKKKLTLAQKSLSKVDKTGMKDISSFFGKKRTK